MCYFFDVEKVRDVVLPRNRAIRAWKGFDKVDGFYVSPFYSLVRWHVGVPKRATKHGFYAVAKRPSRGTSAAGLSDYVKLVLLWGHVREYRNRSKHGYLAQFCVIPKPTRRKL